MAVESASYISQLDQTNPNGSALKAEGDNHIRLLKTVLQTSLPNISGPVTVSHTDLNNITTTQSVADTSTKPATTAFVKLAIANVVGTSLPSQAGNAGKYLGTDGTTATWGDLVIPPALTPSTHTTTAMTGNVTLTAASTGAHSISSSVVGASVVMPDATTLDAGRQYVLRNTGSSPFGIRANGLTLLSAVPGGKVATLTLLDKTTAAGVWAVDGQGLAPGLVTVDAILGTTYSTAVLYAPSAALTNSLSVHFLRLTAGGLAAVAVDSAGRAIGTPVTIDATAAQAVVHAAFVISSTQCVAFWGMSGITKCVVLTATGTSLAAGTVASAGANLLPGNADSGVGLVGVVRLSSTLYLLSDGVNGTGIRSTAVSVSGATCTIGTPLDTALATIVYTSGCLYPLTSNTALFIYEKGGSVPYTLCARVLSVSGTTVTANAETATSLLSDIAQAPASCLLSATKAIIAANNNQPSQAHACALTISGTSVTAGTPVLIESGLTSTSIGFFAPGVSASRFVRGLTSLTASTAFFQYSSTPVSYKESRCVVLSEAGGVISAGSILTQSAGKGIAATAGQGYFLPVSPTEALAATEMRAATPYATSFTAHKIAGSNLTAGESVCSPELNLEGSNDFANLRGVKLTSGDYLAWAACTYAGMPITVMKSDGNAVSLRGTINLPSSTGRYGGQFSAPDLGNGTLVIGSYGGLTSGATQQLRLMRVEVAA